MVLVNCACTRPEAASDVPPLTPARTDASTNDEPVDADVESVAVAEAVPTPSVVAPLCTLIIV